LILDTNAISALADNHAGIGGVIEKLDAIAIPVIVLGEFRFGLRQSKLRLKYENWLDQLVSLCRVLIIDEDTASEYALVREELKSKGQPIPTNDAWIAALARQHSLGVLSRDAHFDVVARLKRLSW